MRHWILNLLTLLLIAVVCVWGMVCPAHSKNLELHLCTMILGIIMLYGIGVYINTSW